MAESNIQVVCRIRPQNKLELSLGGAVCLSIDDDEKTVQLENPKQGKHSFVFDHVFGMNSDQKMVYDRVGQPIVDDIFKGYNGTVFVYGQTGSGKTFTMMGPNDNLTGFCDDSTMKGIIPRIIDNIFFSVDSADSAIEFTIQVSYLEIYLEKIRDLLDPTQQNLRIKEDRDSGRGIYVQGATEEYVTSSDEVFLLIKEGAANRTVSATRMNEESSRSHSILIVTVSQKNTVSLESKSGKLFLVDLAGSEKVKKTGAAGKLLEEAKNINKSLSCLGNVINALTDGKSKFIPYRDSKLTRLLQDSLGGNSRTTLIINCSSSTYNDFETLSTLRFGIRAKSIKNKPKVNRELSVKELTRLLEKAKIEIAQNKKYILSLEKELKKYTGDKMLIDINDQVEPQQELDEEKQKINENEKAETPLSRPDLDEKVRSLEDYIAVEKDKLAKANEEKEKAKNRYNELSKEYDEKMEYYREVERDLNSYMNDLRTMNSMKTNEVAELKMSLEKIEYESTEKDFTIENLEIRNETANKDLNILKQQVSDLKNQIEELERIPKAQEIRNLEDFIEVMNNAHNELVESLEQQAATQDEDISILQKRKEKMSLAISSLKDKLSCLDAPEENESTTDWNENDDRKTDVTGEEISLIEQDNDESSEADSSSVAQNIDSEKQTASSKTEKSIEPSTSATSSNTFSRILTNVTASFGIKANNASANAETHDTVVLLDELQKINMRMAMERETYEKQILSLMNDLTNRCDKVVELEMLLDEARDKHNQLFDSSALKKNLDKIAFLQRSLQATTTQLHDVTQQRNNKDLQIKLMENKLNIRDDRISNLDTNLKNLINKTNEQANKHQEQLATQNKTIHNQKLEIEKLTQVIRRMEDEFESTFHRDVNTSHTFDYSDDDFEHVEYSEDDMYTDSPHPIRRERKIVKPLRGGGGKRIQNASSIIISTKPNNGKRLVRRESAPPSEPINNGIIFGYDSPEKTTSTNGKILSPEDYFTTDRRKTIAQNTMYTTQPSSTSTLTGTKAEYTVGGAVRTTSDTSQTPIVGSNPKRFSIRDFFFPKNRDNGDLELTDESTSGTSMTGTFVDLPPQDFETIDELDLEVDNRQSKNSQDIEMIHHQSFTGKQNQQ